jgi:hypothetical protein
LINLNLRVGAALEARSSNLQTWEPSQYLFEDRRKPRGSRCRESRSQDLPDAHRYLASTPTNKIIWDIPNISLTRAVVLLMICVTACAHSEGGPPENTEMTYFVAWPIFFHVIHV